MELETAHSVPSLTLVVNGVSDMYIFMPTVHYFSVFCILFSLVIINTAPGREVTSNINITRINDGTAANITWMVLPLDRVGGHASFQIVFSQSGTTKRQTGGDTMECAASGCRVPYQQGGVIVGGLDPNRDVIFRITPTNEEGEEGTTVTQTSQR